MGKKNLNQSGMLACVALQFAMKQRGKTFFKKKTDGRAMARQSPN